MSNSYENDYISILLNINKRLRDQVEKLYALLKCKVEIDYSSNDKSRIKSVLSDLEIISSNLSLHMEEQASLIEVIKQIDNKHKELIKQNDLINHQVQSIESLSNDNLPAACNAAFSAVLAVNNEPTTPPTVLPAWIPNTHKNGTQNEINIAPPSESDAACNGP